MTDSFRERMRQLDDQKEQIKDRAVLTLLTSRLFASASAGATAVTIGSVSMGTYGLAGFFTAVAAGAGTLAYRQYKAANALLDENRISRDYRPD